MRKDNNNTYSTNIYRKCFICSMKETTDSLFCEHFSFSILSFGVRNEKENVFFISVVMAYTENNFLCHGFCLNNLRNS